MAKQTKNDGGITPKRVVIRHTSGTKANQVDEFPLDHFKEITVGRTATSNIKYDPDRDDLVSRQHAKIVQDESDPAQFTITDLSSRNGTFVNKQRIIGLARIVPGDVIQLGPGGPEFQFDLEPRPDNLMRRTRVATAGESLDDASARPTRAGSAAPVPSATGSAAMASSSGAGTAGRTSVGRATVERMVTLARSQSNRTFMLGGVGVIVVLLFTAGWLYYQNKQSEAALRNEQSRTNSAVDEISQRTNFKTPTEIAAANTDKVVYIEAGWKLMHVPSGSQVYHLYVPLADKQGKPQKDQNGNVVTRAAYLQQSDGSIEPVLVLDDGDGRNRPIGGQLTGSGFVVTSDGFILTNRHVAATWNTSYPFPPDAFPGLLYAQTEKGPQVVGQVQPGQVQGWVPAEAKSFGYKPISGKILEGRTDYMDVTFAKNELRIPAQLVRISNKHDVAMIKIDIAESREKVDLYDSYDSIQTGNAVTVMGYPAVSPDVVVTTESNDPFNRARQYVVVPDPTVTNGNVGRIIRGHEAPAGRSSADYYSFFGDSYQLTINATGGGNSGGPVFDDQGRVIGIYYAGKWDERGTRISFAVPIRYGIELMGTKSVLN